MRLERLGEQIIEVDLVSLVDAGEGDGARVARRTVLRLARARGCDGGGGLPLCVSHLGLLPVLEGRVRSGEVCDPGVGAFEHSAIDTILMVLLLVSIEEEIEAGQVAEGDELSQGGPLLAPQ